MDGWMDGRQVLSRPSPALCKAICYGVVTVQSIACPGGRGVGGGGGGVTCNEDPDLALNPDLT